MTLCLFLSQVLDPDHSCRAAVARLIVWLAINGRKPCAPETGSYCEARQRLPLGVVVRLVHRDRPGDRGPCASEAWLWKGRRVTLVDGTTASMPDTAENQEAFPQSKTQELGLGFPLVRMVALISLATGVVRDLAMGPYQGKETGETALFRTLWEGLDAGEIVLGDRYFASFFGIAGLSRRGVDVAVPDAPAAEVRLPPGPAARRRGPRRDLDQAGSARMDGRGDVCSDARGTWTVRELRVTVDQPGFRVNELVLVTTLLDAEEYAKQEVADFSSNDGTSKSAKQTASQDSACIRPQGRPIVGVAALLRAGPLVPGAAVETPEGRPPCEATAIDQSPPARGRPDDAVSA